MREPSDSAEALDGSPRVHATALLLVPYALGLAAWFFFFHAYWGTFSPTAPYGTHHQTSGLHLRTGLPGLLFDQEYGVVPYAPIVLVGIAGLWHMWRAGGTARTTALELAVTLGALVGTVGAFRIWWGGSAAPGRPVASGLALLAIPIAWQYARAAGSPVTRATYRLLVLIGVALAGALVFAQEGLLIANDRDGSSRLLEWLSPNWRLWALFPSFIFHLPWTAAVYVVLWLAIASATLTGLRWLERRKPNRSAGGAGLAALLASLLVIALASVAIPVLLGPTLQPDVRLDARSRVRVLDRYDAQRRPTAIVYDPFRRVPAPTIPWLARLVASPNHRAPRQPVALLFNRRFSLPAGEYEVDLHGAPGTTAEGVLALQLGRVGPPAREWPVRFEAQGAWSARFVLPIDVGFVGFRASSPLDRDIRTLRVRPIHVVDAHARLRSPQVLGTAHYGDTTVFIHDEKIWPEPGGFWTAGGATATVTLARREEPPAATGATGTQEYLRLRVHCGPVANVVTFSTGEWSERLPIAPGEVRESILPARAGGPSLLRITTQSGFTPAELEPDNLDERVLGAWIEIVGGY